MNGKENIINKILSDADTKCAKIITTADAQAKAIVDEANELVAANRATLQLRIDAQTAERKRNRLSSAELDAKKYSLQAKQQLIARCYDLAYERLAKLSDNDRLAFISTLISKYAEVGETVYVTKADAKTVTQTWLNGFNKQLKLGKQYITADGGIVLEGDGYDKDLTLSSVIRLAREQTESKVADLLLGARNE